MTQILLGLKRSARAWRAYVDALYDVAKCVRCGRQYHRHIDAPDGIDACLECEPAEVIDA